MKKFGFDRREVVFDSGNRERERERELTERN
jgi:hypothetical protein